MKVYPIPVINLEEAKQVQFDLVDKIHCEFSMDDFFCTGDVGLARPNQFPTYTEKVEKVLSNFFKSESALLVRGAGSGAIRYVLNTCLKAGDRILVHDAPIYPTSLETIKNMGLEIVSYDYNKIEKIGSKKLENVNFALIQYSRQKPNDKYDLAKVTQTLKKQKPEIKILSDDNYLVFKAKKIGYQLGADVSAFSIFKLLGPEGIGCLIGKKQMLDEVRAKMYSGGSKVQGYEAMEALRSIVYAPVAFAIQAEVADETVKELNSNFKGVKKAYIVNAQSRVILVEFEQEIAKEVLEESRKLGASSYPVGSESRYEIPALFYRVSGTFRKAYPNMEKTTIRINPMRAGKDTILRILREAIDRAIN